MKRIKIVAEQIFVFVLILLSFSMMWCIDNFGNIGLSEIIFTLNMPLKGTANSYFLTYFLYAFCPTVILFGFELFAAFHKPKHRYGILLFFRDKVTEITILPFQLNGVVWIIVILIWFGELISIADDNFAVFDYVKSQMDASEFIESVYNDAGETSIIFPEQKRNLICIYMESAETSFQDKENGGFLDYNIIPEMTQLAYENVSFSHSELLEGAAVAPACGWTMAGLVAQTSGLPLKLFKYEATNNGVDNSMGKYAAFMPGATAIGEILEREGYQNVFMAGSDFTFGGRRDYFTQHGNYEIWDYNTAVESGKIPSDYKEGWGFEDAKLYEFAKEKLTELAASGQPFNFSMLTVDTHTGGGYLCELCPDTYDRQYANVWACASNQVYQFVEWIMKQDFCEDTVICITGDHCSMEAGFFGEHEYYERHSGETERKVYNVFINPAVHPVNMKNRKFTTMDFYPTMLAAIGADIDGERLGLGTNLFSDVPTIAEEYGYDVMFAELNKRSRFYDNNILYPEK